MKFLTPARLAGLAVLSIILLALFLPACSMFDPSTEQSSISNKPLTQEEHADEFAEWADKMEAKNEALKLEQERELERTAVKHEREIEAQAREFEELAQAEAAAALQRRRVFERSVSMIENKATSEVEDLILGYDLAVTDSETTLAKLAGRVEAARRDAAAEMDRLRKDAEKQSLALDATTNTQIEDQRQETARAIARIERKDERRTALLGVVKQGVEVAAASGVPGVATFGSLALAAISTLWGVKKKNEADAIAVVADKERTQRIEMAKAAENVIDSIDTAKDIDPEFAAAFKKAGPRIREYQNEKGKALVSTMQSFANAAAATAA